MNLKLLKKKILKLRSDCIKTCCLTHPIEEVTSDNDEDIANYLKAIKEVKEFENDLLTIDKFEELGKKYTFKILLQEEEPK